MYPFSSSLSRAHCRQGRWPHIWGPSPALPPTPHGAGTACHGPWAHPFPHRRPACHLLLSASICERMYVIGIPLCPRHCNPLPASQLRFPPCFRYKMPSGAERMGYFQFQPVRADILLPSSVPPLAQFAGRAFTVSKGSSTPFPSLTLFQRLRHNWGFLLQKTGDSPKEPPVSQFSSQSGETQRVLPQRGQVPPLSSSPSSLGLWHISCKKA